MKLSIKGREARAAYLFILGNVLGFLIFTLLPVIFSLVISFFDWQILDAGSSARFIEFYNFIDLLGFHTEAGGLVANDARFWHFLYNTLFLMIGIPLGMGVSLFLALVMNQKLRGIIGYRTIFFLPSVTAGVALYLLWTWIYNNNYGLLNMLLAQVGIDPVPWLTSTTWAKPSFILMGLWTGAGGYNMILYLAALQGVDPQLYEAAEIDGASAWRRFWHVTWPMISPTTFFILVMSVIYGFQGGFEAAYIMTEGGPEESTTTLSYYVFQRGFQFTEMGYAAAIAWVLFIMIFVITVFNWKFGGKVVTYE